VTVNGACMQPWFGVGWSMSAIASKYPGSMVHMRDAPNAPPPASHAHAGIPDWGLGDDAGREFVMRRLSPNTCPLATVEVLRTIVSLRHQKWEVAVKSPHCAHADVARFICSWVPRSAPTAVPPR
jgi:hypothetical protein